MKKLKNEKPGLHGKRVKGFALRLNLDHWFTLQTIYRWLKGIEKTTPEMDTVIQLMPNPVDLTDDDFAEARTTGSAGKLHWNILKGTRTFRVRAEHVEGAKQLLRSASAFLLHGQAACTLARRADMLEKIGELDLLVDAAR